jgi:hypothetical protein
MVTKTRKAMDETSCCKSYKSITSIWNTDTLPQKWKWSIIVLIHKKLLAYNTSDTWSLFLMFIGLFVQLLGATVLGSFPVLATSSSFTLARVCILHYFFALPSVLLSVKYCNTGTGVQILIFCLVFSFHWLMIVAFNSGHVHFTTVVCAETVTLNIAECIL